MRKVRRDSRVVSRPDEGDPGRGRLPVTHQLVNGRVCDDCKWPDTCREWKMCWAAEKADIARDRP